MEDCDKLPLKRVELSLTKFNEVAIPHHLGLLRQHKANILKYESEGAYSRVRSEQTHARRVTSQLRALLGEVGELRARVAERDLPAFDAATQRARDLTLRAIMDYLGTSPLSANRRPLSEAVRGVAGSAASTDSVGLVAHAVGGEEEVREGGGELLPPHVQLQVDDQELQLREREAVLRGWSALQEEVRALHAVWGAVSETANRQRELTTRVAASASETADNVSAARAALAQAERIRAGMYGVGGAALGAAAGGPLGLVVGAKAGAAAALCGSLIGYLAARVLGRHRQGQIDANAPAKDKDD